MRVSVATRQVTGSCELKELLALHPEIVILELGGNDGLRGIPVESMQSNLEKLILAFQNGGHASDPGGNDAATKLRCGVHQHV